MAGRTDGRHEGTVNKNYWATLQNAVTSGTLHEIADLLGNPDCKKDDINCSDENGETPLYKAVSNRNIGALPPLIAFGADVDIPKEDGKTPLSLAADMKEYDICRLLCDAGANVDISKWRVPIQNMQMLSKQDQAIIQMIKEQGEMKTFSDEQDIVSGLFPVKPGSNSFMLSEDCRIKINSSNSKIFFLYLSKVASEFDDIRYYLEDDQRMVSDEFKIQCWGYEKKTLDVTIQTLLDVNFEENLSTFTLEGTASLRKSSELRESAFEYALTEVNLNFELSKSGIVRFGLIETDTTEVFKLSKAEGKLYPRSEPGSVIDIPAGTFESGRELYISFADAKHWKMKNNIQLLFTNVMRIRVSGGYKPRKPVTVTLPIHSGRNHVSPQNITILHSSIEEPEEQDWDILNHPITNTADKLVSFQVDNFSWFSGASLDDIQSARQQATQAVKDQIQVEIFTMMKRKDDGFSLVVEMTIKRKAKERRKRWKDKRKYEQQSSHDFGVKDNKTYKITFSNTLNIADYREKDIIFRFTRRDQMKFKTFTLVGSETPSGVISFNERVKSNTEEKKPGFFRRLFQPRKDKYKEFNKLFDLEIGKEVQTKEIVEHGPERPVEPDLHLLDDNEIPTRSREPKKIKFKKVNVKVDPSDPNCTVCVLRKKSLYRLAELLNLNECDQLGRKLLKNKSELRHLARDGKEIVFELWRTEHQLPNKGLATQLADLLEDMGKMEVADVIRNALSEDTEFNYVIE